MEAIKDDWWYTGLDEAIERQGVVGERLASSHRVYPWSERGLIMAYLCTQQLARKPDKITQLAGKATSLPSDVKHQKRPH